VELVQYGYHYSTEAKQSSTIIDPGVPPTVIRCICFHSVGCNRILSVSIGKKETFLLRMLEHRDAPPESLSSSCHDDNNNKEGAGLCPIEEYITRRRDTLLAQVTPRPLYHICQATQRMPGTPTQTQFWWEQFTVDNPFIRDST